MDGDLVTRVLSIVGQVIGDLAIELDLAIFGQQQNKRSSKLLGHGSDAKSRVGPVRDRPFHIRHPKTFLVDDLALFSDQHRPVELPVVMILLEQLVDLLRRLLRECVRRGSERNDR